MSTDDFVGWCCHCLVCFGCCVWVFIFLALVDLDFEFLVCFVVMSVFGLQFIALCLCLFFVVLVC